MNKPMNMKKSQVPDLNSLVNHYVICKGQLSAARMEMDQAEQALLDAVGAKEEGSTTIPVGNYKVTTTGKINRSLDAEAWDQIKTQIPEPLANRLVRYKPDINLREFRYVETNEPDWFAIIAKAVTSKPAKASVKVE